MYLTEKKDVDKIANVSS